MGDVELGRGSKEVVLTVAGIVNRMLRMPSGRAKISRLSGIILVLGCGTVGLRSAVLV